MQNILILRSVSSSEIDFDNWYPLDEENVSISLDLEIGYSDDNDSSNMFYVSIITPYALKLKETQNIVLVKNRTLVISNYCRTAILNAIQEILGECSRSTWEQSCEVLQRYFLWEYEDYSLDN